MLFRHGWNAKQVQTRLGHHSPAFTLSVYVHLLPDDLPEPSFLDELGSGQVVSPDEGLVKGVVIDSPGNNAVRGATEGQHNPPKRTETKSAVSSVKSADSLAAARAI